MNSKENQESRLTDVQKYAIKIVFLRKAEAAVTVYVSEGIRGIPQLTGLQITDRENS